MGALIGLIKNKDGEVMTQALSIIRCSTTVPLRDFGNLQFGYRVPLRLPDNTAHRQVVRDFSGRNNRFFKSLVLPIQ